MREIIEQLWLQGGWVISNSLLTVVWNSEIVTELNWTEKRQDQWKGEGLIKRYDLKFHGHALMCVTKLIIKWYYCYLPVAVIIQEDLICILGILNDSMRDYY